MSGGRTVRIIIPLVGLLFACQRPPARLDIPKEAPGRELADGDVEVAAPRPSRPPLPVKQALDVVPRDALAVMHAPSYRQLLVRMGRDRVAGEHPDMYADVSGALQMSIGVDLADPDQLPRVGVDPDGPVGFAVLDIGGEAVMGYCRLLDAKTFTDHLSKTFNGRVEVTQLSTGTVIHPNDSGEVAFIIRGQFATLVFADRPERQHRDWVRAVAEGDPRQAIAHDPRYVKLLAELGDDAQFVGLFDPGTTMESAIRADQERSQMYMSSAPPPPPQGATAQEIVEWERQQEEAKRWEREAQQRQAREREAWRELLSGISAAGWSMSLSKGKMQARGAVLLGPDSVGRKLLRPGPTPKMMSALTRRPLMMVGGDVDIPVAIDLLDRAAQLDGAKPGEVQREFQSEFGLRLEDVGRALTGEMGVALTLGNIPKKANRAAMDRMYGVVFVAGLRDAGAAGDLLALFARHNPGDKKAPGLRRDAKHDAYVFDTGDWRPVYVAIVGDHIVATTELAALTHLRTGKPVALDKRVADAELRRWLERPAAAVGFLDMLLPMLDSVHMPYSQAALDPVAVHPDLSPEELASVPKSKKYRAKYREYKGVLAKLEKAQLERANKELVRARTQAARWGKVSGQVRITELGVVGDMTWKMGADDIAAMFMSVIEGEKDSYVGFERTMELSDRRWQLENELRELRTREIEDYIRKKAGH